MTVTEKLGIAEPESALSSFWYAVRIAEKDDAPLERLVRAVDGLDRDFMFTLKDFSDATVETDKAKLKLKDEGYSVQNINYYNRCLEKERKRLETFESNISSPDILRDFLIKKIIEKGVKINAKYIGCCKEICLLYKTRSRLTSLKSKGCNVEKELAKLVIKFAEYGISIKL